MRAVARPPVDQQVEVALAVAQLDVGRARGTGRAAAAALGASSSNASAAARARRGGCARPRPRRRRRRRARCSCTSSNGSSPSPSRLASSWIRPRAVVEVEEHALPMAAAADHATGQAVARIALGAGPERPRARARGPRRSGPVARTGAAAPPRSAALAALMDDDLELHRALRHGDLDRLALLVPSSARPTGDSFESLPLEPGRPRPSRRSCTSSLSPCPRPRA